MLHTPKAPLALIILDGWGHSDASEGNANTKAYTPNFDAIRANFPSTDLLASGSAVGLDEGVAGDPEVGHQCIGTGRAAPADISRIEHAIRNNEFQSNVVLSEAFEKAARNGSTVHLIGLLSDGGIHSSTDALFALLRMAKSVGARDVAIHCILDGVDVRARSADIYVEALEIKMADIGVGRIASLCGRYFAMDSRGNWERTARVYTMLVHAEGERSNDAVGSIRNSFLRGIADEFIAPIVIEKSPGEASATVKNGDLVVYFNHRPETIRQLVRSLSVPDSAGTPKPMIDSICMIEYDRSFELPVAFKARADTSSLTDVLAAAGIRNIKITQTERFPHLTYFFNGGAESQSSTEQNILLPTPRGEALDLMPESQSFRIADKTIRGLESDGAGVFVVNLPAAGLTAQTGNFEKTIEALQFVDTCLGGIVKKVASLGGTSILTSSYAKCDRMIDSADGEDTEKLVERYVPFVAVGDQLLGRDLRSRHGLADIAPTMLQLLGLDRPPQMTGESLL